MTRLAALALAALAAAAGSASARPTSPKAAGSVKGTVRFDGAAPVRAPVRRDGDAYCAKAGGDGADDDVIVRDGAIQDVVVRIKHGSFAGETPAMPPAVIDQQACTYTPHVIGIVVGQKLSVRNSDGTFHNVRGQLAGKPLWNRPASPGDPALSLEVPSARPGDVIEIGCDVHPWMHAYAVVVDHAKFAITGADGAFAITGVPPGTYTIEAWHPVLGVKAVTVKVGKAAATARFTYTPADVPASPR
jgi:plastocyanin